MTGTPRDSPKDTTLGRPRQGVERQCHVPTCWEFPESPVMPHFCHFTEGGEKQKLKTIATNKLGIRSRDFDVSY